MRGFHTLLILAVLTLGVSACASSPALGPTATPIALRATATPAPLPTRSAPAPTPIEGAPAPAPETLAPIPTVDLIALDESLARRTVEGFLSRLVKGEIDSAASLFLTDDAKQGPPAQLLSEFATAERALAGAEILDLQRTADSRFEGQAILRWGSATGSGPSTQIATLALEIQRGLWLIDELSLGDLQAPAPNPTRPAAAGGGPAPKATAAPLAGTLVFQARSGGDIYRIEADGSGLKRLTDGIDPVWSPDGTQIALSRWRDPRGIWIVGLDGSERHLFDWGQTRNPAWSPDGAQIVFTRQIGGRMEEVERCFWKWCFTLPPNPHWRLGIVRVADGTLIEPPGAEISLAPTWSPDGRRIVYHDEKGLAWLDVASEDLNSGRFAGSGAWDTSPAYSPDGSRIVFTGRVHDRWEILIMNADGSGRTQLTETYSSGGEPRDSVAPAWSPDGRTLAFLSNREGPWRIYVMQPDGSGQRSLFGNQLDSLGLQYDFSSEQMLSWGR